MCQTDINPEELQPAVADYSFEYAASCPGRTAMSSEYGDISYAELGLRVQRLALALQRSGVQRGDRVAVLTTPWDEFRSLSPAHLNYSNGRPVLVDCWRILDRRQYEHLADYVALGTGPCLDGRIS